MTRAPCGPDLVAAQVGIEEFALSPDGSTAVYVRRHVDGHAYRSHVWSVPLGGGAAHQLTDGSVRDASPALSPDGRRLAFVRTPQDAEHGQVWLLDLGGAARQVVELPHGASSVSWSPDGLWLAVLAPSAADRPFIVGAEIAGKAPTARRMTRLDWRDDDDGHRDRRTHLVLVAADGSAEPAQLTRGDWDVGHPAWSPDSRTIAFVTDRRDERDVNPRSSIWTVAVEGGEPRELAALAGDADRPAWSPDGARLAFLGCDVADAPEYEPSDVWVVGAGGGTPERVVLEAEGLAGTWAWSELDLISGSPGPRWLDDSSVVVLVAERARCVAWRVPLDGGAQARMFKPGRVMASGLAVAGGRVVVSATVDGRAAELYAVDRGALRQLTDDGSAWQARCPRPRLDEVEVPGPGGPINTWIVSPAGAADEPLPTILHFHGGPTGSFGPGASFDALVWTAAGYRVVMPNLRGSAGFGYAWADALAGSWGEVDAQDALAVVDWLIAQRLADERRIGLYGLSYGGFLVNWLIGVTDRFAAAVTENGVVNQVSTWANSYIGVHYNRRYRLGDPLDAAGVAKLWSSSPLANVARIATPLLMLQAEDDRVCPAADAEQLFTALRTLGREVEYVAYPEEHHEMKAYGRPDRRIDRLERMLAWFGRYLL